MTDLDTGQVHSPRTKFGKVPEAMMHNPNITDGAIRLYAHMHWRYGINQQNFEGRQSMAAFLGVSKATITKRVAELEANDWIVVKPQPGRKSNIYHVFVSQKDCKRWREKEGVVKPEHEKVKPRKSRKGVGGKPSHVVNSSLPVDVNLSLPVGVNSSSQELDSKEPDSGEKITDSFTNVQESVAPTPAPIGQDVPKLPNPPKGNAWVSSSETGTTLAHLVKSDKIYTARPLCRALIKHRNKYSPALGPRQPCPECLRAAEPKPKAVKELEPWSALTKAMHEATPEDIRPVTCNYDRNDVPAHALYDAGFTPERITAFVNANYPTYREWAEQHKKPVLMSMHHVNQYIKAWEATKGKAPASTGSSYLDGLPDYGDYEPPAAPVRPTIRDGPFVRHWYAEMSQLEIQLNKATFDTWFKHIRLVEQTKEGNVVRFVAVAQNVYAKDWIEKHVLRSIVKALKDMCSWSGGKRVDNEVEVVIELEEGVVAERCA